MHQDSLFRKCKWIALLQMKKDISMEEWSIFFSATFLTCQSAGFHLQNWPFDWMFPWGKWKILIWKKHTARIQIGVASHNFFCGIIRQIGFGELKFRCEFFRFIVAAPHNNTWCRYKVLCRTSDHLIGRFVEEYKTRKEKHQKFTRKIHQAGSFQTNRLIFTSCDGVKDSGSREKGFLRVFKYWWAFGRVLTWKRKRARF